MQTFESPGCVKCFPLTRGYQSGESERGDAALICKNVGNMDAKHLQDQEHICSEVLVGLSCGGNLSHTRKGKRIKEWLKRIDQNKWTSKGGKKGVFLSGKVRLLFVSQPPGAASTLGGGWWWWWWRGGRLSTAAEVQHWSGIMHTHTPPSERQCGKTRHRERCYYFVCELLPDSAHFRKDSPSAAG